MSLTNSAVGLDQHRLALGMRLAGDRRARQQAGRERRPRPRAASGVPGLRDVARCCARSAAPGCGRAGTRRLLRPSLPSGRRRSRASPMPVASFGDRKNGWPKSSGRSSIQTFSSFCQSVNSAVDLLGVLDDVGERLRRWPGGGGRAAALPGGAGPRPRRRGRPAAGAGRVAPAVAGAGLARPAGAGRPQRRSSLRRATARAAIDSTAERARGTERTGSCGRRQAQSGSQRTSAELSSAASGPTVQVPSSRRSAQPAATVNYFSALKRRRCGRAPSSPRRFFLSASYSW